MFSLLIMIFNLYTAGRALQHWTDYKISSQWTILGFLGRLVATACITFVPWWYIFGFSKDDNARPAEINAAARVYMSVMLNVPLIALSFVLIPGLAEGSMIAMELAPFTIIPYMVSST